MDVNRDADMLVVGGPVTHRLVVVVAAALAIASAGSSAASERVDQRPGSSAPAGTTTQAGCRTPTASPAYTAAIRGALLAKRDVWGEQLLAARDGPTYEAASRYLAPLLYGTGYLRGPFTRSGVYYIPFSYPLSAGSTYSYALHLADGSEIITRRLGGPSLSISVGAGGSERYGSCLGRLTPATLADGWLPILETSYVDSEGVRYGQESFAGRVAGVPSIVSFVRLSIDARHARVGAVVRLIPSEKGLTLRADRRSSAAGARLIFGAENSVAGAGGEFRVAAGRTAIVYADWLHIPSSARRLKADGATYRAARARVASFWRWRLAQGTPFSVPEPRIRNAELALLVQQIGHEWRYSIGNPYEELSFAESTDTAEVMARFGFGDVARTILLESTWRLARGFTVWRVAERLVAGATYYRLFRDDAFLAAEEASLRQALQRVEDQQVTTGAALGLMEPERLSSDLPTPVTGLPTQLVAWQGLLAMSRVWGATGHTALAEQARRVAVRLERALRPALRAALVRLPDGSIFVPEALVARVSAYDQLTASRAGSYWNLIVPYALSTGFFAPRSPTADGIVAYMLDHGSRLLGVTREDAHVLYRNDPPGASGLDPAYGLAMSRFLADNDQPDQLVLSLYGLLAAGMTPDTHIAGESETVEPFEGAFYRTTYLPPNSGVTSTFLETLALMLIHEQRGPEGAQLGLDLAFSTPRSWLADGKAIRVNRAPTSFGRLSYAIVRKGRHVHATVDVPASPAPEMLRLRLRLPKPEHIVAVRIGSRSVRVAPGTDTIDLSGRKGHLDIDVTLAP